MQLDMFCVTGKSSRMAGATAALKLVMPLLPDALGTQLLMGVFPRLLVPIILSSPKALP